MSTLPSPPNATHGGGEPDSVRDVHAPPSHALSKLQAAEQLKNFLHQPDQHTLTWHRKSGNGDSLQYDKSTLVDVDEKKLKGELMDLQHGLQFVPFVKINASTAIFKHSKLCITTAGARQRDGESRKSPLERNTTIFKGIIPQLIRYNPDTVLCVVSNPVDLMTYVTWKMSGLPHHRVFGSGTSLDSSRFRYFMSERLGIDVGNCHGFVIGEHGDASVVVWGGVNVAGVRLSELNSSVTLGVDDPENWKDLHTKVINSAYEIIRLKGYTSWAIGMCVSELCNAVLKNKRSVYALSTFAKGFHGIQEEVFFSLPCVLAENGINAIITQTLGDNSCKKAQGSYAVSSKTSISSPIKFREEKHRKPHARYGT